MRAASLFRHLFDFPPSPFSTLMDVSRELDTPYLLDPTSIATYQTQGFVKLKQVLNPALLSYFEMVISEEVEQRNPLQDKAMSVRNTYEKAFIQIINLWRVSGTVRQLVFSKRLAQIATALMKVGSVRLYHDQALYKEPGGGLTPWHADQYYWPLSTPNTCTVWIPLQETPVNMGPVAFSAGSQHFEYGRDLAITDESEAALAEALAAQRFPEIETPYDLGEVSYHAGWTFHRAGPNGTDHPRRAMTIIYMEDGIRLIEPQRPEHHSDRAAFLPGLQPGDFAATPMNPLLYQRNGAP